MLRTARQRIEPAGRDVGQAKVAALLFDGLPRVERAERVAVDERRHGVAVEIVVGPRIADQHAFQIEQRLNLQSRRLDRQQVESPAWQWQAIRLRLCCCCE